MVQILPPVERQPTYAQQMAMGLVGGLEDVFNRKKESRLVEQENEATKRLGIDLSGIRDPELRKVFASKMIDNEGKKKAFSQQLQQNQKILRDLEKREDLEEGSLSAYESNPAMAAKVIKKKEKSITERPIEKEQLEKIQNVRSQPGFEDMDEFEQLNSFLDEGVSRANAETLSKGRSSQLTRKGNDFDKWYNSEKGFIDDTTKSYRSFETDTKPKLLQMRNIKDEDLASPTAAVFLDALGIPLGALKDPSSELYQKLSLDLLKGLPETYGNRILKVEVDNFLKTIPSLMNSPDGRRMIASNMLKLGEMKEVYYNAMRGEQEKAIKAHQPVPDFQQKVFDQVKPQIDRINNEFVKLSEIKSVPKDTIPFFSPNGEIEFVEKEHAQWAQENGGKRIW